jgi:CubicO group peptidase (beta-lactamase class C family)
MTSLRFRKSYLIYPLLILSVLLAACGSGRDEAGKETGRDEAGALLKEKLDSIINHVVESFDLPGLAVGVVKDNEIIYAEAAGYKNIETQIPLTTSTLFHMASVSKPFVATAVMQLKEQGKIDLDARVTDYLPYFKLDGDKYRDITIQHMLCHVSGMPDVEDYEWDKPQYDEGALERYVRGLGKEKMIADPATRFQYSNMAFECLGDVIAKVSGMSFADYEKQHILDPLGMKDSTFLKPENLPDNWAAPHLRTIRLFPWEGYPYNRQHGPSSTLHSSVLEMCRWATANLNRGELEGKRILDPESYNLLWRPMAETGMGGIRKSVGLSWFLGEFKGEPCVSHGGGDMGFNTNLVLLPQKSIAIVVLCNYIPAPLGGVTESILDILLGHEPQTFKPLAGIKIGKILDEQGLEEAVREWNRLKEEHGEEYNFEDQQFRFIVALTMDMGHVEEGQKLIRFLLEILPEESIKMAQSFIQNYARSNPDNKTTQAMLQILENI